ncbi:type II secretion system protein [Pseudidiomarina halophila]|uniref:Type II secretion system protein GspH n=1 Tax=Pseudidiomarina halophila TaxID=1449799 RepID=A0A432XWP8_9GAMM|nr:type II secretion system protein [Pseudidiomarina halophila]RUO53150.1 hypothetical protein CWI69_09015 [Pseudidiomarina halophila]
MIRRRWGFTLIELLVVLTIVGVAASLIGPVAIEQYERTKVTQEREQLLRIIDDVTFRAYTEFQHFELEVEGNQWLLKSGSNEPTIHKFDFIEFKRQSFDVNSHGFWSNDLLFWLEGERQRQTRLNPERIEGSDDDSN